MDSITIKDNMDKMAASTHWLRDTMEKISQFREEQEAKILASRLSAPTATAIRQTQAVYQSKMILNNKSNKDSIEFFDLIDKNLLIVSSSIINDACWPMALVTISIGAYDDKRERSLDLGALESHGSLWKMSLRPDAYPGTRVILQANEIGETPSYLRADLTFHESIEVAAVWTVYTVSNINQPADMANDETVGVNKQPHEGIIVRFELFEGPTGYGSRSESRFLVSVVSQRNSRGIALMTETEMKKEGKDQNLEFGINWELLSESAIVVDPDIDFDIHEI